MAKQTLLFILVASLILLGVEAFPAEKASPIEWFSGSFEEALDEAGVWRTFVMLVFFSEMSAPSRSLENETLFDPGVVASLRDVICFRVDAVSEGEGFLEEYSVDQVPTCLFLKPSGIEFGRLVGYRRPGRFKALLSLVKEAFKSGPGEKVVAEATSEKEATKVRELRGTAPEETPAVEREVAEPPFEEGVAEPPVRVAPSEKSEEATESPRSRVKELYGEALRFLGTGRGDEAFRKFLLVQELDPKNSQRYYEKAAYQILGIQVHDIILKFTRLREEVRRDLLPLSDSEFVSDEMRPLEREPAIKGFLQQAGKVAEPFIGKKFGGTGEERQQAIAEMEQLRTFLFEALAAEFDAYLKRFPETKMKALTLQNLQRLYFKVGDVENGARVSEELIRLGMDDVPNLCRYARNLAIYDFRLDRARELAQKAYAEQPESLEVLDTLALIEFKSGNLRRAVELQEKAVSLAPGTSVFKKRLYDYRKALEEKEEGK